MLIQTKVELEDRMLPVGIARDALHVIDADHIQRLAACERRRNGQSCVIQRKVSSAAPERARLGAYGLQEMALSGRLPTPDPEHRGLGLRSGVESMQFLDDQLIRAGEETLEDRKSVV